MELDLTRDDSILEFTWEGQRFRFVFVDWDSVALGKPVFHLSEHFKVGTDEPSVRNHLERQGLTQHLHEVMLTARIPASDIVATHSLQKAGLYFVELTLHPNIMLQQTDHGHQAYYEMQSAQQEHLDLLLSATASSFTCSRFFRDPLVPKEAAESRFLQWLRSSRESQNKNLWIFLDDDGEPLGYFLDRAEGESRFLELTAMFGRAQGRGHAKRVWETYLANHQARGVVSVSTNISAENSKVVGLYPKLGFNFLEPSVVLHGHF